VAGIRSAWINRAHRIHDVGTHTPDREFPDLLAFAAWAHRDGRHEVGLGEIGAPAS